GRTHGGARPASLASGRESQSAGAPRGTRRGRSHGRLFAVARGRTCDGRRVAGRWRLDSDVRTATLWYRLQFGRTGMQSLARVLPAAGLALGLALTGVPAPAQQQPSPAATAAARES